MWRKIIIGSEKRGYDLDIDMKYIWDIYQEQQGKCALSGISIFFAFSSRKLSSATASLDRIDSSKGYIKGNVQWVHKSVNMMKRSLPNDIFIGLCHQIGKKFSNFNKIDIKELSANHFIKHGAGRKDKNPDS